MSNTTTFRTWAHAALSLYLDSVPVDSAVSFRQFDTRWTDGDPPTSRLNLDVETLTLTRLQSPNREVRGRGTISPSASRSATDRRAETSDWLRDTVQHLIERVKVVGYVYI